MITEEIEVELRFWIDDANHINRYLPQVSIDTLKLVKWNTLFFGKSILESGRLFRLSKISDNSNVLYFVGWKERDEGGVANIRREFSERVDIECINSSISKSKLSYDKEESWGNFDEIDTFSNQKLFMGFSGANYCGQLENNGLDIKIMTTNSKNWPVLVELEKTANTMAEALAIENELFNFVKDIGAETRLINDEPPSLLYKQTFLNKHPVEFMANKVN